MNLQEMIGLNCKINKTLQILQKLLQKQGNLWEERNFIKVYSTQMNLQERTDFYWRNNKTF